MIVTTKQLYKVIEVVKITDLTGHFLDGDEEWAHRPSAAAD